MKTVGAESQQRKDSGFTLIELLVVVVIIGILAAIAIPVFLNQRQAARNASVQSDMRNVATVLETGYALLDRYPASGTDLMASPYDAKKSTGNDIQVFLTGTPVGSSYVLVGCNFETQTSAYFFYDASGGGFTDTLPAAAAAAGWSCPTTDPSGEPIQVN